MRALELGEARALPSMHERNVDVVCTARTRCGLMQRRGRRRARVANGSLVQLPPVWRKCLDDVTEK